MPRASAEKKKYIREMRRRYIIAMSFGVLLAAAVIVLTIIARVEITALSDETAKLEDQLELLHIQRRNILAEYESEFSLSGIATRAEEIGMVSPGATNVVFIEPPQEDMTVMYPAYSAAQMDKSKSIWEYFD